MCNSKPTAKKVSAKGKTTAKAPMKRKPAVRKQAGAKSAAARKPASTKAESAAGHSAPRKPAARKTPAKKVMQAVVAPLTGPSCIELETNTGIAQVNSLHTVLTAALDKKTDIVFNASSIEMIDTAVLQLLCSFAIQARKENLDVRWESPSESLLAGARLLDLDQHLGLR